MPLEKIRALEAKTAALQAEILRLNEHDAQGERVVAAADRLSLSTEALTGALLLIKDQTAAIRDLDTKAEGIRTKGDASRRRLWRGVSLLGALVAVLLAVAIIGGLQVHRAREAAHAATSAAAQVAAVDHQQCLDRNAGLQVTISRERSLAETDVPATRPAHLQSANRYAKLIRNCDAVYPTKP